MKALVLGGTGGMGQGVARDLIKQEQIKKVILGDINTDLNRVQEKLRASEKVSARQNRCQRSQWPGQRDQ